ncbi:hypothetical protein GCM10007863_31170 [Dyella mobilis]|nr:hypothetical protein GCM10007863_31170 [Dyella mobilis]
MARGLITWQWAPDRDPARQASQLLSLTRPGSTFQQYPFVFIKRLQMQAFFLNAAQQKAGARPASAKRDTACQAFFGVCEMHQPFELTALPGNSWHGPKPVAPPE